MPLYTISGSESMPLLNLPSKLRIEETGDVSLLSRIGKISPEDVIVRLANDHLAFVAYMNNEPAGFGWMARSTAKIGELNHTFILPERNRYLWNFRTLEAFRGMGIYPALLQFIIRYESRKADRFWIIHAPENTASSRGIIKAGFNYVGKLTVDESGSLAFATVAPSDEYQELLEAMELNTPNEGTATCWNCSSPYLKTRKATCCCSENARECAGDLAKLVSPVD